MKFDRIYRMRVILDDQEIVIELPLSIEINVERVARSTINTATFTIYNLSERNQRLIFKDRYRFGANRKWVTFEGGYGDTLTRIFTGDIFQAYTVREGVDVKTVIECRTGYQDLGTTRIDKTFAAGITLHELIDNLIGEFTYLQKGEIGGENPTFNRPVSISGTVFDALRTYTRNTVFIDEDKVSVADVNEVSTDFATVISPDTGLLDTPLREETFLTVNTLFDPQPSLNGVVELRSETAPIYNGQYRVIGATHTGIISGAVGGSLTSKFNLLNSNTVGEFNVIGSG